MDNKQPYNPYQSPKSNFQSNYSDEIPELYNPNACALWSILLTPFGAWMHAKNWEALGEDELAQQNKIAFWVMFTIIIAVIFLNMITGHSANVSTIVMLLIWYFSLGKKQILYVKENYDNNYEHKSLVKPVLLGIIGGVLIIFVISFIFMIILQSMGLLHENFLK